MTEDRGQKTDLRERESKKKTLFSAIRRLSSDLPPLLLAAERVAAVVRHGTHGRHRAGQGESFWQFRRYSAGDPAHSIDWRQSARSDHLFVRQRERETVQSMVLWADTSDSMQYSSHKDLPDKAESAQILMLALADLLLRGGERVIWLGDEAMVLHEKTGLERAAYAALKKKGESRPPAVRIDKYAHMVLASDFLMPNETFDELMRRYGALNLKGALLHILDPAEADLPFEGRLEMQGCEGETPLLLANAGALHAAYRERMEAHEARLKHAAHIAGWYYLRHVTNAPPYAALLQLYQYLTADAYPFAQPSAQRHAAGRGM
jgi:uncharacterized protein (DUF58 family)